MTGVAEDRPAGSPVSVAYWIVHRDADAVESGWFWVERVVQEIPATTLHTVVVEPLQPHPVSIDACRLGPLRASGRLSSDAQSVQVTLFGSVELEFRDLDGQKHWRRHPFVLRRDVPVRDLLPAGGVRVAPAGRVVSGQVVKSGRRPAYRARLELLMLVHCTEAVLRQGLPGYVSPVPVLLPVQRVSPGKKASPETHPPHGSDARPAPAGSVALQGLVELASGYRLTALESRLQPETLLVRVLAEHPDGSRHSEEFAVTLPTGDPGSLKPRLARENVEPHPHLPGQYLHYVELSTDRQESGMAPALPAVDPSRTGEVQGSGKNDKRPAPAAEQATALLGAGNGLEQSNEPGKQGERPKPPQERQEESAMAGNGGRRRPRPVLVWKIPGSS